eukprot:CAMPEP_0201594786 /NCGR_PEP_ID=MMETSP0190_2-20130828/191985_1 /ASSEMBLY_ACC=CAM_ASM_000263 /TAXON_ID=37353 /ORGANISM="Rosalina sp." /LENGTH=687 /DNA_ID=CAMNT_0048054521 /DNA_START=190 /DNA_END=2253 /DNA_ORIENTATION=+
MSTSTHSHSHSHSPITGTTTKSKSHKIKQSNGDYQEQRKKFIQSIYNQNNQTREVSKSPSPTGLLNHSSTSHAASESFIRDAHSPLFNAMDPSQRAHKPSPLPALINPEKMTKYKQIHNDSSTKLPSDSSKLKGHTKSFTVTPPNSPTKMSKLKYKQIHNDSSSKLPSDSGSTKLKGHTKSFTVTPPNSPTKMSKLKKSKSFTSGTTKYAASSMATMQILKDLAITQEQQHDNDKDNESKVDLDHEKHYETEQKLKLKPLPLPSKLKHAATTTNIHQNVDIVPPKKMKKKATIEELQLVLDHFQVAKDKDIEAILRENEPHVLEYRDKMYEQARKSGINQQSEDMIRLKVLGHVVQYAYMNIEPPNDYTKQTDRKHFKEVGAWTAKFAKDKGIVPPLTLIYSAWCHDIERFIPATKCEYLPEAVDKYRKQVIHGVTSAKVATCLLKGAPVTQYEIDRIYQMVLHHDIPHPREDIVILGEKLIAGTEEDLMWELELLMDADSFAFFQSTIVFFILFKSKKNSPDWIWERVRNNVKRLRPHLRPKAAQCIHQLSHDILTKMNVNYQELAHLCSDSGSNSIASSDAPLSAASSPPKPKPKPKQPHVHVQIVDLPKELNIDHHNREELPEISENENVSYLSAENLTKMTSDTLEKFTNLKINESNNSNTSHSFESEHLELVNVDPNDNKSI